MKATYIKVITKLMIFVVLSAATPFTSVAQDRGAKTIKTDKGGKKSKRIKSNYRARRRMSMRHWSNQDRATRKRMKRSMRNARRRQKGKSMRSNRLV